MTGTAPLSAELVLTANVDLTDANNFTYSATIQLFDADGNLIVTLCGRGLQRGLNKILGLMTDNSNSKQNYGVWRVPSAPNPFTHKQARMDAVADARVRCATTEPPATARCFSEGPLRPVSCPPARDRCHRAQAQFRGSRRR